LLEFGLVFPEAVFMRAMVVAQVMAVASGRWFSAGHIYSGIRALSLLPEGYLYQRDLGKFFRGLPPWSIVPGLQEAAAKAFDESLKTFASEVGPIIRTG
jgi:hypothetical protein